MRFMQVLAKSAVAYAVAQEVLRLGNSMNLQMRVATGDTVVSGIHIPEGTNVWLCPQQVCTLFRFNVLCMSFVVRMWLYCWLCIVLFPSFQYSSRCLRFLG
jgi:hypothetical protein